MFDKLNEKDKRTLKMGGIGVVAILVFFVVMEGYESWNSKKDEYKLLERQLKSLDVTKAGHAKTMSIIPVFTMPEKKAVDQMSLFRDKLNEQFSSIGIQTQPWQEVPSSKASPIQGYGFIKMSSSGSCTFSQLLELLAILKQNPYLVGIEEMNFVLDSQNTQRVNFTIQVSTVSKK